MKLVGTISFEGRKFICMLNENKSTVKYSIFNELSNSDIKNKMLNKDFEPLTEYNYKSKDLSEYIREYMVKRKIKNEIKNMKGSNNQIIQMLLDTLVEVKSYGYKKGCSEKDITTKDGCIIIHFQGRSDKFSVMYTEINKELAHFSYTSNNLVINLMRVDSLPKYEPSELVESSRVVKERVYLENVSSISFESLCSYYDTSWLLNEDGTFKPNYRMIESIQEFEDYVMSPLLDKLKLCIESGRKLLLSMDTETTGLNVFNLPSGSDIKDHIVTMQISWEDEQSVLINFDMEKFGNVPVQYAMERLYPLVKEYIKKDRKTINVIEKLNGEKVNFCRNDILVIGHNTIFDSRVSLDTGYQWFFDEDTMQMRFNLDPVGSKGKKGLKTMSKEFLGIEQWELSDTLGKGNEDKFRYIQDRRVAIAYGCADSDLTRRNWKILRRLTPDDMYIGYRRYNRYMWYILAQSEYDGIRIDHDKLVERTKIIGDNLERINQFIFNYVGSELYKNQIITLAKARIDAGISKLKLEQECERIKEERINNGDLPKPFVFKVSGKDLKDVMYNKLKYPITNITNTGEPAVNKETFKLLMSYKSEEGTGILNNDLYTSDYDSENPKHHNKDGSVKKDYILISKKEFNKYIYPLAYILTKYKEMDKEYTGYYLPFSKGDWGGRIYKTFSTTNIETQRISNPIQTTKKELKKMIIAYDDDWYPVNWDKAQIEARVFVAEAGDYRMVNRLNDPEKDYHTENASLMFDTPAYMVSKPLRKASKTINFGLPYGLGVNKMCERIHDMVVNEENKIDTQMKIAAYKKANILTWNLLESYRDSAIVEWKCSDEFKKYLGYEGRKLGHVVNKDGFHRLFDLTEVIHGSSEESAIRRAAGNFPIQSLAKDIFCLSIIKLYLRLGELGLRDKFKIHMLVHDEIQCSVHKSIDPVFLMKLFVEECMPRIACAKPVEKPNYKYSPNDTAINYFIGINFGDSWYECKQDQNECPVLYVMDMVKKLESGEYKPTNWCDRPRDIIEPTMHEFFKERVYKEFKRIQPSIDEEPVDFDLILSKITNYTVRAYVTSEFRETFKTKDNDLEFISCGCGWVEEFYKDKQIKFENKIYNLSEFVDEKNGVVDLDFESIEDSFDSSLELEEDDEDEDFDDFFSFDDEEERPVFNPNISPYDLTDKRQLNIVEEKTDGEKIYEQLINKNKEDSNVSIFKNIILIECKDNDKLVKLRKFLIENEYKAKDSKTVRLCQGSKIKGSFRVSVDIDIDKLSEIAN